MTRLTRRLADRRGIAMIIVLMVITVLTVLVLDLHQSVRINFYISSNLVEGIKANYLVRSGMQVAAGALLKDIQDNKDDHWNEDWYDFLAKVGLPGIPVADDETILIDINDESGRFDLNYLIDKAGRPNKQWGLVFQKLLAAEDIEPEPIYKAIVDWIDPDTETLDGGGLEDQVYGYDVEGSGEGAKNARFESIQEVRLVAGVTDEVWQKIEPLITIYGNRKMNLNTVNKKVMKAVLLAVDEKADTTVIDKIDDWRKATAEGGDDDATSTGLTSGEGNYFSKKNTVKVLTGEIGMDRPTARKFLRFFGTASNFFRVDCTALVHGVQKNAVGIIFRRKKEARIVYYRVAPGVNADQMRELQQGMGGDAATGAAYGQTPEPGPSGGAYIGLQ